jgi:hypothetical protein
MKITRLLELKQKLYREKDLAKIWLFYMDHFADRPKFTDLGEPAVNQNIEYIIDRICREMFKIDAKISDLLLIYIEKYQLFHGSFSIEGQIGGLIYFEEVKRGLLAVSDLTSGMVKYSRFTEMTTMQHTEPKANELN